MSPCRRLRTESARGADGPDVGRLEEDPAVGGAQAPPLAHLRGDRLDARVGPAGRRRGSRRLCGQHRHSVIIASGNIVETIGPHGPTDPASTGAL